MALSDLIARLDEDAGATVRRLGEEAEDRARAIEGAARQEHERRTTSEVAERQRLRLAGLARQLTEARRTARARELEARASVIDRVLARARERFADVTETDIYHRHLEARCDEALSFLDGVPARVVCRPADAALLAPIVGRREGVTMEPRPGMSPGLAIEAVDGSATIDETLDARLSRLRGRLAIELMAEVDRGRG